ncbi:P1 family peptidase [Sporanaerobacter sp. PP17-6a]|jgi:D-aminopeptidase|uniref:P1 family peptidase n=1 Tax=Sporanaerobacter sp. PP17-6a TaxID=1891289 RepID=UPI0008A00111|nr:P1 family peptidase [Sporanaerobacter sp. PP17-6a]MBE6081192.1 P1 family peptidase [Tissierellaceae bacterium]SCL86548.1 L-aminopeptidase/D-esterase [Sporanaerobacter sp. PP17-6a]
MSNKTRIEDYDIKIGKMVKGRLNKITDVEGVKVGHCTIDTQEDKTGVTVILPHGENIFKNKLIAAAHVFNGFGKTTGLIQIDELGTLETPIALTNTLNVGIVYDSIVEYVINECEKDNIKAESINPIICECNDSGLSNIKNRAVRKEHVLKAIESACEDFEEGDVGAGKGTSCHQLKGGIGSASRIIDLSGGKYTVGVLVQSNYGLLNDFTINGNNVGKKILHKMKVEEKKDKGSIIMIVATDLPVSSRQLKRICKRTSIGLAKLGSYMGNGSGEIVIGFSTANIINSDERDDIFNIKMIKEGKIDLAFRAAAEACEEAVLNSMITAHSVRGYKGNIRRSLKEFDEYL